MKKTILIGLSLSLFAILLIPSVPAVELSLVKDEQIKTITEQFSIISQISDFHENDLLDKQTTDTFNLYFEEIINNFEKKIFESDADVGNDEGGEPRFFPFLGIFIYLAIAYVLLAISVIVLRFIGGGIRGIFQGIKLKILQFIGSIISIVSFIITLALNIVKGALSTGLKVGTFILDVILLIFTGIFTVLLILIQGIGNIIADIWNGIGTILQFILEIISVIIETIFPNIGVN
ncbi:hypothetical protein B6U98_01140 [Thermoplasmatales archaeon ex4572_165]|nr:MAG: hypothetical protein B6U98_01140 [Thermoplasmatales archaeon ex4572_165]